MIPYVWLKDRFGNVREYFAEGVTPEQLARGERRQLDCMDCHNRPSHPMAASPERAVDAAIARGEIPRTLPFLRREAVKALKVSYPTHAAGSEGVAKALREFYRTGYQDISTTRRQEVDKAVTATQNVFERNVFPEMKVNFGTHPNNIGHVDSPGCFRCHDESHKTKDGKTIGQDCESCHKIE